MSKNINTIQKITDNASQTAQRAGIAVMTLAAVAGMVDLPNHPNNKIILPGQASFAFAGDTEELNNPIRREKEETEQHYVSYSVVQRTPGRSGRQ